MPTIKLCPVTERNLSIMMPELQRIIFTQTVGEQWNIGAQDLFVFIRSSQIIFYLLYLASETGEQPLLLGSISIFNSREVMSIGSFVIFPEYRGKGYGSIILTKLLADKVHAKTYLLSAPGREALYRRHGFTTTNSITSFGTVLPKTTVTGRVLSRLSSSDITQVLHFDQKLFGIDRSTLLRSFIEDENVVTYFAQKFENSLKVNLGYGILRTLHHGYRISISALTMATFHEILSALFTHLLNTAHTDKVEITIDSIPGGHQELGLRHHSFQPQITYEFMTRGSPALPHTIGEHVWGILTEEHG